MPRYKFNFGKSPLLMINISPLGVSAIRCVFSKIAQPHDISYANVLYNIHLECAVHRVSYIHIFDLNAMENEII